jgi:hypothetical protein
VLVCFVQLAQNTDARKREFPGRGCTAEVENLNASYLEHFARVHSQPLLQNYSWTLKDQLDGIGMPIGVLWANYCFA